MVRQFAAGTCSCIPPQLRHQKHTKLPLLLDDSPAPSIPLSLHNWEAESVPDHHHHHHHNVSIPSSSPWHIYRPGSGHLISSICVQCTGTSTHPITCSYDLTECQVAVVPSAMTSGAYQCSSTPTSPLHARSTYFERRTASATASTISTSSQQPPPPPCLLWQASVSKVLATAGDTYLDCEDFETVSSTAWSSNTRKRPAPTSLTIPVPSASSSVKSKGQAYPLFPGRQQLPQEPCPCKFEELNNIFHTTVTLPSIDLGRRNKQGLIDQQKTIVRATAQEPSHNCSTSNNSVETIHSNCRLREYGIERPQHTFERMCESLRPC